MICQHCGEDKYYPEDVHKVYVSVCFPYYMVDDFKTGMRCRREFDQLELMDGCITEMEAKSTITTWLCNDCLKKLDGFLVPQEEK